MFTFYLMTEKGYSVLNALVSGGYTKHIDTVIASRDKNNCADYFDEIKSFCGDHNIKFYERGTEPPVSSTYSIAISWRWMIQDSRLIVLHDSLLPRYRGFAPLVTALINGEKETGVTALYADAEFDRGRVILQKKLQLTYPIKIADAVHLISGLYAEMVCELADRLLQNERPGGNIQDEKLASYSLWLDEEDYRLNWEKDAESLLRFIHATGFPYKGASVMINDKKARVTDAESVSDEKLENRTPGKVLFIQEGLPVVVCGTGLLKIKEMTWEEGGNALPLKNFRTRFK